MLNTFVKWITSSETRPYINLKYKDLEALTEELISIGDTTSIIEIRKELEFRKFTRVSLLMDRIDKHIEFGQREDALKEHTVIQGGNEPASLIAQQENTSQIDIPGKSGPFGLHIRRNVAYRLIEEDSDALFTPVRDDSGISIRINKDNPLGPMIYKEVTSRKEGEACLLGLLIEAIAEYEIEEIGMTRREVALLRRAIGKKLVMKMES